MYGISIFLDFGYFFRFAIIFLVTYFLATFLHTFSRRYDKHVYSRTKRAFSHPKEAWLCMATYLRGIDIAALSQEIAADY